ncbi:TMCC2 family protein [Megaselia abdita]
MSKERESHPEVQGGGTSSGLTVSSSTSALRFRQSSPSDRRSRERNRRNNYSDQTRHLVYDISLDGMGSFEDSRLSGPEELNYQSFVSDEIDSSQPTKTDSSNKKHRRHQSTSSLQAFDRLGTKIQCTKELIRKEQTTRDENVNEYLKLAASADKQQLPRIKAVFEKKNAKSAHTIQHLQKKLENYTKRAKDIQFQDHNKSQHRQPREVLRDVGQGLRNVGGNIRDGITGFSDSVMSKPREFAHLIKNKFGSADNINSMSSDNEINNIPSDMVNISTPNNTALQAGTTPGNICTGSGKFNSDGSEMSSVTSESIPAGSGKSATSQYHIVIKSFLVELHERKEESDKLKERIERLETQQKEYHDLTVLLEGERYRSERLEEQINDLTELHQNEIENLKQTITDMEEKVQYQSDERLRDVNEVLENCQTRISKMEHMSQLQSVTVDGIDNSNARALVVKLINVVLTVLQVILLLVATAAGIIMPFLKTRVRVLTTFFSICLIIFVIRQWPDVNDIGSSLVRNLKESLVVK